MGKRQLILDTTNKSKLATFDTVTVDDVTAITLLAANDSRVGYSSSNIGTRDVVVRYKTAALDNNIEGYVLLAGESKVFHNSNYLGEISSIRLTTTGTTTSDVIVMEW